MNLPHGKGGVTNAQARANEIRARVGGKNMKVTAMPVAGNAPKVFLPKAARHTTGPNLQGINTKVGYGHAPSKRK